jgi:hypothetical protein
LRDWDRLGGADRARIAAVIEALRAEPSPTNLDERALEGAAPWRRLRVGDHRIIFRRFTAAERRSFSAERGYVVERVIDRRDLDRAVKGLR